ncbi:hypothetical protein BAUCODRAFT_145459 [Baudoinia panamericana UAMH 10762]|uniref:feruloyl esterase n=1 Tax=Baudoinia panamericana (strain UAMH 10762) TaxID=717646 RepID=M2NKZ8_BAUPA|nr:uncharacterized protein BAUCODRAFT_145459 [Baudoinia panamericana UAMH 10762]EMD00150.1 hypothetical protein BAUCODRAFT_145459 [Baudoinia panamericana UAMH 10762]
MQPSRWGSKVYRVEHARLNPGPRYALLHLPTHYGGTEPSPLIVALHGKAQPAAEFEEHTQLSKPEVQDEAIVVYPEGIKLQWLGDPEAPSQEDINDIGFIGILIDQLGRDYAIDKHRVYVTGFSNGGGLADLLAGDHALSGRIAAFAIASGALYTDSALKEPLFSHPNPDHIPSTPDGVTFSLPDFFEIWARRNNCDPRPNSTELYGGKVTRYAWLSSDQEATSREVLIHYRIGGFGHGWPTTRPLNNDDQRHGPTYFDATPVVMDWFRMWKI